MTVTERILHTLLSFLGIILIAIFAVWWFQISHIPANFEFIPGFDLLLFLILTAIIWHPIVMNVFTWLVISHIPPKITHPEPQQGLKLAFLTTFVPASEDITLLHQTLPAMVAVDYPHDTWLLDEGNDPRAKAVCEQYGVKYFTRNGMDKYNQPDGKFKAKTKGGNHNAWHDSHGDGYDVVAQIDTDFIPRHDFLTKTLGYFKDPSVGFVGTPQVYGNTDQSLIALGAAEQTYGFYGPLLRGLSGMRSNTLIGANHIIRTKALDSVDHYSAHITEDLLTGMKLHAQGWKSEYVPEALAIGEGPTDWQSYLNQQMRWAYGCMDILKNYSFKLFRSMTLRQSIYYFLLQQHYFTGLVMILGIGALLAYFWFGIDMAQVELYPFLFTYIPVLIFIEIMNFWIQRFHIQPQTERGFLIPSRLLHIGAWPIYFLAFIGVIRGEKLTYKVTPKGENKTVSGNSLRLFTPHFNILLVVAISLFASQLFGRDSLIMITWAMLTIGMIPTVPVIEQIYQTILPIVKKIRQVFAPLTPAFDPVRYVMVPALILFILGRLYLSTVTLYQTGTDLPENLSETPVSLSVIDF